MFKGSLRRHAAAVLVGTMATLLAACGMSPTPIGPQPFAGALSGISKARKPTRFGLRWDAKTPRVRYVPGSISAGLPARVDLRAKLSPIDDQGDLNSCTGFAVTGLAEYLQHGKAKPVEMSPGFIYVMELKAEKRLGEDGGARISTGMNILKTAGIAPETLHPYLTEAQQKDGDQIVAYLKTLPTAEAFRAAKPFRVKAVKAVNDLADFKTAIAQGRPVVFGFAVYSSGDTDEVKKSGIIPMPKPDIDGFLGGHAILAVGYDEAKQQIIFRNSYGPGWGDKGYGYLPYTYFQKELVGDAWQAL